jgi:hypothetical protein
MEEYSPENLDYFISFFFIDIIPKMKLISYLDLSAGDATGMDGQLQN